jgi:hypothetical protein
MTHRDIPVKRHRIAPENRKEYPIRAFFSWFTLIFPSTEAGRVSQGRGPATAKQKAFVEGSETR